MKLAKGQPFEKKLGRDYLERVSNFPSGEAIDLLVYSVLESHPGWCKAAVEALRVDERPQYRGIGDEDRKRALNTLAMRPTRELSPHFSELADRASGRLPAEPWWAFAVADLLAFHHEHELAAKLADRVVDSIPDTQEMRSSRNQALDIAFGHRANARAMRGDFVAHAKLLEEWSELLSTTN